MNFIRLTLILCFIPVVCLAGLQTNKHSDYLNYHKQITEAEMLIGDEKFKEALIIYEEVFKFYDFIFVRDYQVASQLAFYLNEKQKAFNYIKEGIAAGWELKALKKNNFFNQFQGYPEWDTIEKEYDSLRNIYLNRIDQSTRDSVHLMFKKDQKKALGALFKIGNKAQERYGTKKFAPHSEIQITKLIYILENQGYPGEQLIGNNYWMSTILSHHNSISEEYSKKDTLYNYVRPKLIQSIKTGHMSPYEFAFIDDWYRAVSTNRTEPGYGFLNPPVESTLPVTDDLRQKIGLRTVELRNKLVNMENRTGMDFYLPDWIKGKIVVGNQ